MTTTVSEALSISSETSRAPAVRALELFAAWLCSLAWGFGALTITHGFLSTMYGDIGLVKRAAPLGWTPVQGFIVMVVAPTVLGLVLSHNWRGLVGGLLGIPISLLTPIIWFLCTTVMWNFASRVPELTDYDLLERMVVDWGAFLIAQGIVTVFMIAMLVSVNGQGIAQRGRTLKHGLAMGSVLAVASFFILVFIRHIGSNSWQSLQNFYWSDGGRYSLLFSVIMGYILGIFSAFLWQIPPLVWVTVIYFTEREKSPNQTIGTLMWMLFIVATFSLPFVLGTLVRLVY